jgi:DNA-binding NarL/FixJ family response regulator
MIRLAICDDYKHFINTMRLEIMDHDDIELVGECNLAVDCIPMLTECQPDVLLLDIQMETSSAGIDILPKIKELFPDLTIIMITVSEIEEDIFNAITNGANNYILKDMSNSDILKKVVETYTDQAVIDNAIFQKYLSQSKIKNNDYNSLLFLITMISKLTKSELEILKMLCTGKTYSQIASERFTSESTVRTIVSHITKKYNVDNINTLIAQINNLELFEKFDHFI